MRLGTSGLGVIALVSLLVTAAPDRNDGSGKHRRREIDNSESGIETVRIPRTYYTWPVRVISTTGRIDHSPTSFVKIEHDRRDSSSRPDSSSFPPPPSHRLISGVRFDDRNTETPAEVSRFPIDLLRSTRGSSLLQNFKRSSNSNDWIKGDSVGSSERNPKYNLTSDTSVTYVSSPRDLEEKFSVTVDSPISNFITATPMPRSPIQPDLPLRGRRLRRQPPPPPSPPGRETIQGDEEIKSYDKKSKTNENAMTKMGTEGRSRIAESAITMNHRLTTMASTTDKTVASKRSFDDVSFRNATEHYESLTTRSSAEFLNNKENGNVGKPLFLDHRVDPVFRSTEGPISHNSRDFLDLSYQHPTNYSVSQQPDIRSSVLLHPRLPGNTNDTDGKPFDRHSTIGQLTNYLAKENSSSVSTSDRLSQENLIRDSAAVGENGSTPRTLMEVMLRKQKTLLDSSVTEEIIRPRQITDESLLDAGSIIGTGPSRLRGNSSNRVGLDIRTASLDNHKAIRVRSFQTTSAEHEQQGMVDTASSSLPSRLTSHLPIKEAPARVKEALFLGGKTETPSLTINQISYPKPIYQSAKNNTKPSINLLDGKTNKIFYEIKPSLITDMDRDGGGYFTTTTRRSLEKFLLPSVPTGKFGPYFLDEEDRRNVTERIGNTLLLNCRIGLLGHRKVTWLQHYKDSFRLLTVEQESYSADRRISLNFQYPDNWRLQIVYASMRDSGLYKCQVEIDQDRSLVKRYNVIITAPILTITDDSGRPISGERHLKAGSALKLRCEARDVVQRLNESVLWMRGDETLVNDLSENRTTEIVNEKEVTVVISNLFVERATPRHAGNYSCVVPNKARTTIAVHVLNGELPAAVQHGSGVSTAVLNIWLVHLTASYGFFR